MCIKFRTICTTFVQENDRLIRDLEETQLKMKSEMADRQRLDDLLDKIQEDKRRLSNRVNKLTTNGK